jgi:hypothetical protein
LPADTAPAWLEALAPHVERSDFRVPLVRPIHLMSGRTVQDVAGVFLRLPRWQGTPFQDDFGKKAGAMVALDGEHLMAELAVLRLLQAQGWDGRWVSTYSAKGEVWKYLVRWDDVARDQQRTRNIEEESPRRLLATIASRARKRYKGCWDVFGWRDPAAAFLQLRSGPPRPGDEVKEEQVDWMHTALLLADPRLTVDSFAFVNWDYA